MADIGEERLFHFPNGKRPNVSFNLIMATLQMVDLHSFGQELRLYVPEDVEVGRPV
jgi:hypothetical protein